MRRRDLLSALGIGIGSVVGCSTTPENSATTGPTETLTATLTPSQCTVPQPRRVSIANTGTIVDDAGLEITATLQRGTIDSDGPALLSVSVTNTGEGRYTNVADAPYCHPFNREHGGSTPDGIWLYRREEIPEIGETCWRAANNLEDTRTFVDIGCSRQQFDAGDAITTTYHVWDDYAVEGYAPTGTYRFESSLSLWPSEESEDIQSVDWWLELSVSDLAD
ncbi:hypothetical protein [Halorhabdus amylolytica]|uniref:hypothetical protein n=1 Tax=Halorhabdus amylolytica TaxID=2559573 RepID=UPI0010AA46A5|nr:hypothetical protein [Halorhabdus amylolytica]